MAARTLEPWPDRPRPKRSCSARSGSARPTAILHLYTHERGRVGAVAKGVRKTKSRFGGPPGAVLPRRARAPPGPRRARDGHGRLARPLARPHPHRSVPAAGRDDRARGDAAALHRAGGEREGVHRADPLPRRARRRAARGRAPAPRSIPSCSRSSSSCSGCPATCRISETCVECGSAEPLVAFLPAAGGGACAACDPGGIALSPEGVHGMRAAAPLADRRRVERRARRPGPARCARRRDRLVRAPRRLPAEDALGVEREREETEPGSGLPCSRNMEDLTPVEREQEDLR